MCCEVERRRGTGRLMTNLLEQMRIGDGSGLAGPAVLRNLYSYFGRRSGVFEAGAGEPRSHQVAHAAPLHEPSSKSSLTPSQLSRSRTATSGRPWTRCALTTWRQGGSSCLTAKGYRPQRSRRSSTSDTMNPNPGQPPDWIDRSNHLRACALSPRRRYQLPRP